MMFRLLFLFLTLHCSEIQCHDYSPHPHPHPHPLRIPNRFLSSLFRPQPQPQPQPQSQFHDQTKSLNVDHCVTNSSNGILFRDRLDTTSSSSSSSSSRLASTMPLTALYIAFALSSASSSLLFTNVVEAPWQSIPLGGAGAFANRQLITISVVDACTSANDIDTLLSAMSNAYLARLSALTPDFFFTNESVIVSAIIGPVCSRTVVPLSDALKSIVRSNKVTALGHVKYLLDFRSMLVDDVMIIGYSSVSSALLNYPISTYNYVNFAPDYTSIAHAVIALTNRYQLRGLIVFYQVEASVNSLWSGGQQISPGTADEESENLDKSREIALAINQLLSSESNTAAQVLMLSCSMRNMTSCLTLGASSIFENVILISDSLPFLYDYFYVKEYFFPGNSAVTITTMNRLPYEVMGIYEPSFGSAVDSHNDLSQFIANSMQGLLCVTISPSVYNPQIIQYNALHGLVVPGLNTGSFTIHEALSQSYSAVYFFDAILVVIVSVLGLPSLSTSASINYVLSVSETYQGFASTAVRAPSRPGYELTNTNISFIGSRRKQVPLTVFNFVDFALKDVLDVVANYKMNVNGKVQVPQLLLTKDASAPMIIWPGGDTIVPVDRHFIVLLVGTLPSELYSDPRVKALVARLGDASVTGTSLSFEMIPDGACPSVTNGDLPTTTIVSRRLATSTTVSCIIVRSACTDLVSQLAAISTAKQIPLIVSKAPLPRFSNKAMYPFLIRSSIGGSFMLSNLLFYLRSLGIQRVGSVCSTEAIGSDFCSQISVQAPYFSISVDFLQNVTSVGESGLTDESMQQNLYQYQTVLLEMALFNLDVLFLFVQHADLEIFNEALQMSPLPDSNSLLFLTHSLPTSYVALHPDRFSFLTDRLVSVGHLDSTSTNSSSSSQAPSLKATQSIINDWLDAVNIFAAGTALHVNRLRTAYQAVIDVQNTAYIGVYAGDTAASDIVVNFTLIDSLRASSSFVRDKYTITFENPASNEPFGLPISITTCINYTTTDVTLSALAFIDQTQTTPALIMNVSQNNRPLPVGTAIVVSCSIGTVPHTSLNASNWIATCLPCPAGSFAGIGAHACTSSSPSSSSLQSSLSVACPFASMVEFQSTDAWLQPPTRDHFPFSGALSTGHYVDDFVFALLPLSFVAVLVSVLFFCAYFALPSSSKCRSSILRNVALFDMSTKPPLPDHASFADLVDVSLRDRLDAAESCDNEVVGNLTAEERLILALEKEQVYDHRTIAKRHIMFGGYFSIVALIFAVLVTLYLLLSFQEYRFAVIAFTELGVNPTSFRPLGSSIAVNISLVGMDDLSACNYHQACENTVNNTVLTGFNNASTTTSCSVRLRVENATCDVSFVMTMSNNVLPLKQIISVSFPTRVRAIFWSMATHLKPTKNSIFTFYAYFTSTLFPLSAAAGSSGAGDTADSLELVNRLDSAFYGPTPSSLQVQLQPTVFRDENREETFGYATFYDEQQPGSMVNNETYATASYLPLFQTAGLPSPDLPSILSLSCTVSLTFTRSSSTQNITVIEPITWDAEFGVVLPFFVSVLSASAVGLAVTEKIFEIRGKQERERRHKKVLETLAANIIRQQRQQRKSNTINNQNINDQPRDAEDVEMHIIHSRSQYEVV